jgi:hypothetical protein
VTHYKVNPILCDGLPDGQHAFCGIPLSTPGEEFHLIGALKDAQPYYIRRLVDCPKCMKMYDAVINDFLARRGN